MSREEDLVRSTIHAITDTVRDVPPLRLEPTADELWSPWPGAGPRPARSGWSRRQPWLASLGAAALVLAVLVVPTILRAISTGSKAAQVATSSVPPYYVAVGGNKELTGFNLNQRNHLVVGETLTGKTLASVTSPNSTTFVGVSAAADDRTFAILADPLGGAKGGATGVLYELKVAPGTAQPARLATLPIKPYGYVYGMAISSSGQELAVATYSTIRNSIVVGHLFVYSIPNGHLLHSWSARTQKMFSNDVPDAHSLRQAEAGKAALGPTYFPGLTWINDDRAIAFAYFVPPTWQVINGGAGNSGTTAVETLRSIDISTRDGDLLRDSRSLWTQPTSANSSFISVYLAFPVTPAGSTVICARWTPARGTAGRRFIWSACPTVTNSNRGQPIAVGSAAFSSTKGASVNWFWASPSGDAVLVEWFTITGKANVANTHFGLMSKGRFTPLPRPSGDIILSPVSIAW